MLCLLRSKGTGGWRSRRGFHGRSSAATTEFHANFTHNSSSLVPLPVGPAGCSNSSFTGCDSSPRVFGGTNLVPLPGHLATSSSSPFIEIRAGSGV
jgi:hypothetical protein